VLEIQPKRYKERGVLAPHWHVAIGCSESGLLPHAKRLDNGRIAKVREGKVITWAWLYENIKLRFGMYFCCDAYSRDIYNYLGKYLAKGSELEDFRQRVGRRVRIFSSSRMDIKYQMTYGQTAERVSMIADIPDLADLYWRREGSKITARAKEIKRISLLENYIIEKISYPKVITIKGDWVATEDTAAPSAMGDIGD
jgi:hypothetical protein